MVKNFKWNKEIYKLIINALRKIKYNYIQNRSRKLTIKDLLKNKASGGKLNRNKKYLLISDSCKNVGILSGWSHYMTLVNFALKNKLIPILDFSKNYMPLFMEKNFDGKTNYWDLFFSQPSENYNFDEIKHSKNLYYIDYHEAMTNHGIFLLDYSLFKNSNNDFINQIDKNDLALAREFYNKCHFTEDIIAKGDSFINEHNFNNKKMLGISFRRCFERLHKLNSDITPEGTHPIKATLEQLIKDIDNIIDNYDAFFFTTDDRESLDVLQKRYGNKCLATGRRLNHQFENGEVIIRKNDEETRKALYIEFENLEEPVKTRNIEYLTDVYILSQCNSLLARGGSADTFAYIINNDKYENIYE